MARMLRIVADGHIWQAASAFCRLPGHRVSLDIVEQEQITPQRLRTADLLLVRSSTRVDAALLRDTPVRFVATATIGDDHIDKQWLAEQGIGFASAAGSSTGSVLEYLVAALFELQQRQLLEPEDVIGVIGAGRIGGRLAEIIPLLGMRALVNDPPRQRCEGDAGFSSLDTLLKQADCLTLHTPLTVESGDATRHLIDSARLARFRGRGIINAARGACVDNQALLAWLDGDASRWAVLDCWENEPHILATLLGHPQVVITTPHIAGHSLDGKAANTQFVYDALCRFLGVAPEWSMEAFLPLVGSVDIDPASGPGMADVVRRLYPIMLDHAALQAAARGDTAVLAAQFVALRRRYRIRRAWTRFALAQLFGPAVPAAAVELWRILENSHG